jgi:hypothetical protein
MLVRKRVDRSLSVTGLITMMDEPAPMNKSLAG